MNPSPRPPAATAFVVRSPQTIVSLLDCLDRSARPHQLPRKATEEERAIVCILPRATNFPFDELTLAVTHFLPHLNRDSIWRILEAEA